MKTLYSALLAAVLLFAGLSARGETRPDFGLKPIDGDFMAMLEDVRFVVVSQDRELVLSSFLAHNAKKFKTADLLRIRDAMAEMSDNALLSVTSVDYKDPTLVWVVSFFVGGLGIDRFLLGQPGLGVLKLVTGGGLCIWWLVDLFTISDLTKKVNYKDFVEAAQVSRLFLPPAKD